MKHRLLSVGLALAVLSTAACGGHESGTTPPVNTTPNSFSGPEAFEWGKGELTGAVLVGPANLAHMQATVAMNIPGAQSLVTYAQQVSDPQSPLYRQYLTPQEIGERFGASSQDYQKVADYFVENGLSVAGWPQHLSLAVAGPQSAMEKAFGTRFGVYEENGRQFVAPIGTPHFSVSLPVSAVENLVTLRRNHTYMILPPRAGAGTNLGYSPQQVQKAFDYSGAYSAGFNGAGITVGIIGTGPINVNRSTWCSDADLAALKSLYNNVSAANVCEVNVTPSGVAAGLSASGIPTAAPATPNPNGTPVPNPGQSPTSMFPFSGNFTTPPPVTDTCSGALPACNQEDGEAQLDTQQVATLAPGAAVDFYLAYNANDCYVFFPNTCASPAPNPTPSNSNYGQPQIGIVEADAEIQQAIADNVADVISISYGSGEWYSNLAEGGQGGFNSSGVGYQPEEFAALAAEGIAVFVSSGDSGSAECISSTGYYPQPCVSYPSGDVNVTSVGGVNAPINEFGQLTNNITAWGTLTSLGTSGSGGGVSTIFTAPSWQQSAISAGKRTQPDVSMIGDPFTGVTFYSNAGFADAGAAPVGGTSVAAPEMSAMWALVLDACKNTVSCATAGGAHPWRLGDAAPYLYAIYAPTKVSYKSFAPHLSYAQTFYDVLYGSNAMTNSAPATPTPGEKAMTGYDQVTGVGVPFAGHLIQAVTGQTVP
ncbi:MAG TPA: protease pro-enzyme activation domain-containing protein [Candidatus Baltobacteraceae bacterium]|nr:protease pro-enzyme activation domain-containing protein [Candidatus Baltobacteraceae bacterium]